MESFTGPLLATVSTFAAMSVLPAVPRHTGDSNVCRMTARLSVMACCVALATVGTVQLSPPMLVDVLLSRYDRGEYEAVTADVARSTSDVSGVTGLERQYERDAAVWLDAGVPASRPRRALVVGALALECAHAIQAPVNRPAADASSALALNDLIRRTADARARFIVWACGQIRRNSLAAPSTVEHWWYLASVTGLQELGQTWPILVGDPPARGAAELDQLEVREGKGGHLAHALARFPDDPRLLLTAVLSHERR